MSSNLAGNYYLANDIDCSASASWNNGAGYISIGDEFNPFTGILDGRNHRIINLTINNMIHWQTGLFNVADGATIKNIAFINITVKGLNGAASIASSILNTNISNCYISGNISAALNAAAFANTANNSVITNCYSSASISGDSFSVGGLVGSATNSTAVHSYWDTETSGQTTSALGEGKTTAEMKKQATFEGWDFANSLWCIRESVSYPAFCSTMSWNMISNCTQLQNMGNNLSGNYQLANDIDCSGVNFTPIGTSFSNGFTGFLDGKNYSIKNLTVNCYGCWAGLFNITIGASIQNVKLKNANISSGRVVGSLAAYAHAKTSIYNCSSSGTVTSPQLISSYTDSIAGGLVAILDGKSTISNSSSSVNVTAVGDTVAGLVSSVAQASTIANSYSTGNVVGGSNNVGGLVGVVGSQSKITDSYSSSSVSAKNNVGGLVGYSHSESSVSSCYATGTVTGNSNVGGLEGYVNGTSTLSSSYAMGTVNGGSNVGGLVGYLYSGSGISDSFSVSSVNGSGSAVGGLVGYARDDAK
ncbi:MAG: ZmpA/ZmpB/ZmpC family metallo-endopeptidase-related protein, partial [Alphaproteobacteria bacterium]